MTTITKADLEKLYNTMRVDAVNEGIAEERNEEDMQPMMDTHFGGVSYTKVRDLVKENYPENFI